MTAASTNTAARSMGHPFAGIRAFFARRAIYKQTCKELNGLTDRELSDIGISRYDIVRIAEQSAAQS